MSADGETRYAAVTGALGEPVVICDADVYDDEGHACEIARDAFRATGQPTRVIKLTEVAAYGRPEPVTLERKPLPPHVLISAEQVPSPATGRLLATTPIVRGPQHRSRR